MRQNHSHTAGALTLVALLAGCTDSEQQIPSERATDVSVSVTRTVQVNSQKSFGRSVKKYSTEDWTLYISIPTWSTIATPTASITVPELPIAVAEQASTYLTEDTRTPAGDLVDILHLNNAYLVSNGDAEKAAESMRRQMLTVRAYEEKNKNKKELAPLTHEEFEAIEWNERVPDIEAHISAEVRKGKDYREMFWRNDRNRGSVREVIVFSKPLDYTPPVQERILNIYGQLTSEWGREPMVHDGKLLGLKLHLRVAGTDGPHGRAEVQSLYDRINPKQK